MSKKIVSPRFSLAGWNPEIWFRGIFAVENRKDLTKLFIIGAFVLFSLLGEEVQNEWEQLWLVFQYGASLYGVKGLVDVVDYFIKEK